ncbi:mitochondrial poly (A) polymerase 1, putative [Bodo saltans]|uniref:RNA uridylyltransferase n=1 Tax=Bodo saltans TaxID=75058 RepID=A0A0S4JJT6_BODSA|nr:mitochondrial poly (A) polymerase 1, putative [Bodo saltans]|eukprot:CUG89274.1 mitochondrial poly (A) polymerase 1, putative [Bodo saltans]
MQMRRHFSRTVGQLSLAFSKRCSSTTPSNSNNGATSSSSPTPQIQIPWASKLPSPTPSDERYAQLGEALVRCTQALDTGAVAFEECFVARGQLESIVRSCGYDMSIYAFGGLRVLGILEVGGDVDFVGVSDVEANNEEAGAIILRLTREMRRLGLRANGLPKARVPIAKVQRVSRDSPGTPAHALSSTGVFQLNKPLDPEEEGKLSMRLRELGAEALEWNSARHSVSATFPSSSALVEALSTIRKQGSVEIPLRLPVDPKHGPELYRYPFDLCLTSTGLRNSALLGDALMQYPYARHLLLAVKRWGRACGIVHTLDGLLASYALTVMCVHFLSQLRVVPLVDTARLSEEPQLMPHQLKHRPLDGVGSPEDMTKFGYLFALFFEYYGAGGFDFDNKVICTTHRSVDKSTLQWDNKDGDAMRRPPYFHIGIKDPYGLDNIGRNVTSSGAAFIREAFSKLHQHLSARLDDKVVVDGVAVTMEASMPVPSWNTSVLGFLTEPPTPDRPALELLQNSRNTAGLSPEERSSLVARDKAVHALKNLEFQRRRESVDNFGKKTAQTRTNQHAASTVAHSMVSWLRKDGATQS